MPATHQIESRTLSDWYAYWFLQNGQLVQAPWANEAIERLPAGERRLDPVALLSLLSHEFICLDRTLVQGLARAPWLGGVKADGTLYTFEAPPHGARRLSSAAIAEELWRLLKAELMAAFRGREHVYMLLSGGMDSRVVSAAIRDLQRTGALAVPVEAVTWGIAQTRDVVYAERLAGRLGWSWRHVPLGPEHHWANFETAAQYLGAECDPKHLHRMTWFEAALPNSVVVAGSYGDSIGRAEYSSVHLSKVKPLRPSDRFGLLRAKVRAWAAPLLEQDTLALRGRHGVRSEMGYLELERQAHYMRRQLCHPMSIINRWATLHQAFSSPELFGFIWSLDVSCRTDTVYRALLERFAPDLLEVEWARTGGRYAQSSAGADHLPKPFHAYGEWLRVEHREKLLTLLDDGTLAQLEVFDMDQVQFMMREWRRERAADNTMLSTQLSMLATLSLFAKRFGLGPPRLEVASSLLDPLRGLRHRYASRARQVVSRVSRPYRVRS